jgi:hypothetical protein
MKQLLRNLLLMFGKKVKISLQPSDKYSYVTRKEFVQDVIKLL